MAEMKIIRKIKFRGSTLLETIVSMVIVAILFGLCMLSFDRLLSTENSRLRLKAAIAAEDFLATTMLEKRFVNEKLEYDDFVIRKEIVDYNEVTEVKIMIVEVSSESGDVLYRCRKILKVEGI